MVAALFVTKLRLCGRTCLVDHRWPDFGHHSPQSPDGVSDRAYQCHSRGSCTVGGKALGTDETEEPPCKPPPDLPCSLRCFDGRPSQLEVQLARHDGPRGVFDCCSTNLLEDLIERQQKTTLSKSNAAPAEAICASNVCATSPRCGTQLSLDVFALPLSPA